MNALAILALAFVAPIDANAPTTAADARVGHRYEVTPRSQIEEGCFDLCACPIALHGGLDGGFVLHPNETDGTVHRFDVRQIKWVFAPTFASGTTFVTGRGTWRVDPVTRTQQLDLDLSLNGAAPVAYSSGLVPLTVEFPAMSVAIQRVGEFCFETRFDLDARPRPRTPAPGYPADLPDGIPGAHTGNAPAGPTSWGTLKSAYEPPH